MEFQKRLYFIRTRKNTFTLLHNNKEFIINLIPQNNRTLRVKYCANNKEDKQFHDSLN